MSQVPPIRLVNCKKKKEKRKKKKKKKKVEPHPALVNEKVEKSKVVAKAFYLLAKCTKRFSL